VSAVRVRAAAAYSIRQGVQLSPDALCREISVDTCRRVLLRGMPAHLLFSAAGVGGTSTETACPGAGTVAEHALCSLRLKASPRDSPPWRMKAEPSGSKVFRLVSWRPCVSRVSAAPKVDRRISEDCVADRRTKRHIGCPGELELICHSSGRRRHASLGLAVGSSQA
jgi:hypothetical protein